jgi:hypothetical protein
MPSVSRKQQIAMAIAEHSPDKLYSHNSAMSSMSQQQLHDFSTTPRKSLPMKVTPHTGFRSVEKAVAGRPVISARKPLMGTKESVTVPVAKKPVVKKPTQKSTTKNPFSGPRSNKGWG